jgi:pimeloyl-[acyl-carrier protein] methyl ester esterase
MRRFAALQTRGDEKWKEVTRRLVASSHKAGASDEVLARGLSILAQSDLRPLLTRVTQPTLLIHGARDALVPLAAAGYLASNVRGAELEIVSSAAHAPFLSEPRRVAKRILEFLGE